MSSVHWFGFCGADPTCKWIYLLEQNTSRAQWKPHLNSLCLWSLGLKPLWYDAQDRVKQKVLHWWKKKIGLFNAWSATPPQHPFKFTWCLLFSGTLLYIMPFQHLSSNLTYEVQVYDDACDVGGDVSHNLREVSIHEVQGELAQETGRFLPVKIFTDKNIQR